MIGMESLVAILLMALVTYLTRIGGWLLLREARLSPRAAAAMEAAPGCVLIAVIAPFFAAGRIADLLALAITILAATRLSMLPTVLIAIAAAGGLRQILG